MTTTTRFHNTSLHYTTLITLHYATLHSLHHTTPNYTTLHYTNYNYSYNYNYTTLHYTTTTTTTTTTAALHTTSSSCGWGDRPGDHSNHCNHSKIDNSNNLSVHQRIRSAIRDSQQPSSPIGFLVWNFRHRLVRYYWYYIISYYTILH